MSRNRVLIRNFLPLLFALPATAAVSTPEKIYEIAPAAPYWSLVQVMSPQETNVQYIGYISADSADQLNQFSGTARVKRIENAQEVSDTALGTASDDTFSGIQGIQFDSQGRLIVTTMNSTILVPNKKVQRTLSVYQSSDRGATWELIHQVSKNVSLNDDSDAFMQSKTTVLPDDRVVMAYAGTENQAIYLDIEGDHDGWSTTHLFNPKLSHNLDDLKSDAMGNLYVLGDTYAIKGGYSVWGAELYKSTDRGESWSKLDSFSSSPIIYGQFFDISSSGELMTAALGFDPGVTNEVYKIHTSQDAGKTWKEINLPAATIETSQIGCLKMDHQGKIRFALSDFSDPFDPASPPGTPDQTTIATFSMDNNGALTELDSIQLPGHEINPKAFQECALDSDDHLLFFSWITPKKANLWREE